MSIKGSVRVIPVDLVNNKWEKRALFLKHEALPEPRMEFKEFVSDYLIELAVDDLAVDVQLLKDEQSRLETEQSDKRLDKYNRKDIEEYLARKKAAATELDDDEE